MTRKGRKKRLDRGGPSRRVPAKIRHFFRREILKFPKFFLRDLQRYLARLENFFSNGRYRAAGQEFFMRRCFLKSELIAPHFLQSQFPDQK